MSHFEERLTQILYAGKKDSRVVIARSPRRARRTEKWVFGEWWSVCLFVRGGGPNGDARYAL